MNIDNKFNIGESVFVKKEIISNFTGGYQYKKKVISGFTINKDMEIKYHFYNDQQSFNEECLCKISEIETTISEYIFDLIKKMPEVSKKIMADNE